MIKAHLFASENPGPRVLIFGAVHGNEVCGPIAIGRVMEKLNSGALKIEKGRVTFVPVANPAAHAAGQRSIERNLNRYFLPNPSPKFYEDRLTNILAPMIAEADYFIDLHSTTAGGIPFASVEGTDDEEDQMAAAMGADVVLFGWHGAYAASGKPDPDPAESMGTTAYARKNGAKGVLLECGQHKDPASADVAEKAILGVLGKIGIVAARTAPPASKPRRIRAAQVVFRAEGGKFTQNWGNFSPVKAGQEVAVREDGAPILSPIDGCIVLPNPGAPVGTEWLYFGVEA